ncbi:MAG: hypothetical protein HXY46_02865 [Syntrophaceae bacterium]|nr:hypothetical protein [Syntrophaceae bacterium]
MYSLLEQLLERKEVFMSIFIAIFTVIYSFFVTYFLRMRRQKRTESKDKFVKTLLEGLKTGSITTMDDLVNIYKGIAGLSSEDFSYRYGLSRQLREFLVELVSKNLDKSIDNQVIIDWKQKISEFIRRNEEIFPYADLPPAERNLLSDISTLVEKNDIESVKRKLLELGGMIQARSDDLQKIRGTNKWSVPLSIIGMVLTIAFGLIAIFK